MKRVWPVCAGLSLLVAKNAYPAVQCPTFIESVAAIKGHPIHPMLVVFPLGLLITSLAFDILYLLRRNPVWQTVAYYMIIAGLVGGALAAIPGFVDYLYAIPKGNEAVDMAALHWHLNAAAITLFAINLVIRWKRDVSKSLPLAAATALSVIGVILLTASGWYGGHLVYQHRVAVSSHEHIHSEADHHPANHKHHTNNDHSH